MKQVLVRQGQVTVEEVPAPRVEPGAVLVRVEYSCISAGTETSGIRAAAAPLWQRALRQPHKVVKAIRLAATQGLARTRAQIQGRLTYGRPVGYSAAGIVLETGSGITDVRPGDRVACAGAQCAHHAEIICVPRNLMVPVPDNVDLTVASTVALGAIALQGLRRAQPTLGETFAVLGLGILGQLTAQMLRANGCRVVGLDIDRERLVLATGLGMDLAVHPDDDAEEEQASRLSGGGVDGVVITAASSSHQVVSTAFRMCRRKGRVVLVGDVGLNLNRTDLYAKELDFLISTSYGPGRYDPNYEHRGVDYPLPYVRWTENRNMAEYLQLVATGRVQVGPLVSAVYPVNEAPSAYASLKTESNRPLMVLLAYPSRAGDEAAPRVPVSPAIRSPSSRQVRLALVGAGAFAREVHLPNLQALPSEYRLQAVVSRSGPDAINTARQFGAGYAATDYGQILADPEVDAVLIATRHNTHGGMALAALQAGKHVLVEKPLALTRAELDGIRAFYAAAPDGQPPPLLQTGFNRRFSPYARRIHELVTDRTNPMILNFRMNAGYIWPDHWVHGDEGGGRNRGEACHIYDLFTYLTGSRAVEVSAQAIRRATSHYLPSDNFVATIRFADGSVATLTYTALGSREYPKEHLEVYVDGKVLVLTDYRQLTIAGARVPGISAGPPDKGHREELLAFARAVRDGGDWPIPLWQQFQATEIALEIEARLGSAD